MITNEMYNDEFGWYPQPWGSDNPDMSNFEHWGHLSQIVWASTTTVGCAWVDCSGGGLANTGGGVQPWFTVCNYGPPGKSPFKDIRLIIMLTYYRQLCWRVLQRPRSWWRCRGTAIVQRRTLSLELSLELIKTRPNVHCDGVTQPFAATI